MRSAWILAAALAAYGQNGVSPSFRWTQEIGGSDGQIVAGVRTDSQGNTYLAVTAASPTIPTQGAVQPHPASSGLFRIDGPGSAWSNLYASGAASVYALAAGSQTIYAVSQQGLIRSGDGGNSWSAPLPGLPATLDGVAVDPANSQILYAATSGSGILKSTNGGASWTPANNGLLPDVNGNVYALHLWVDPNHPLVVFTAADTGLAHSANGGASWSYAPPYPYVFDLSFDPLSPGVVYVAGSSGPLKSTDDGQTWTSLTPLPGEYQPETILADATHQGTLYAGAYTGLWKSTDGGLTWTSVNSQPVYSLAANVSTGALYAALNGDSVVMSTDGFNTVTPVGPPAVGNISQLLVAGSELFVVTEGETDVFVIKLDPQGNIVYSTYFGGSGADAATGLAVDGSGGVYVTGSTNSLDFPVTANAYAKAGASFVFKLNPDGSLAYSTYFAAAGSTPNAIAVDAAGHAYLVGTTYGGLPVTPGAYQTTFHSTYTGINILGPGPPPPTNAFLTKFDAGGSTLLFSTYIGNQQESATAITLDAGGNAFLAGGSILYRMSADGDSLLSSTYLPGTLNALAVARNGNVYIAGGTFAYDGRYPTTAGAFQTTPSSVITLQGEMGLVEPGDAFVTEFDPGFRNIQASTLLGGVAADSAQALTIAPNGNIVVGGYTDSTSFPLFDPVQQSFAPRTGFIAQLTADLSTLLSCTLAGDTRQFSVTALAAEPDGSISFAGQQFFANLVPGSGQLPRIDSVVNAASLLALPLSPGESIEVRGAGFSTSTNVFLGDRQIQSTYLNTHTLSAIVPGNFNSQGAIQVAASSNSVLVPLAATSPGIFYILNADGTRNSPSNPAAAGSAITVFATGAGRISLVGPYAVTAASANVFIGGLYADGIEAIFGPVAGLPGDVYQISVYVPAQTAAFTEVAVNLELNGVFSQPGVALWLRY